MNNDQLKAAFDAMHADDELADRALSRATSGKKPRRRGAAKPLAAVVAGCVAAVLATSGVAYAVVNSNFFAQAWGDHGQGRTQTRSFLGDDGSTISYKRDFGDGTAPVELSEAVEHVGLSVEGNGYTLELGEIAVDENGCGSVTFTLSNPNGVALYESAAEAGELVLSGAEGEQTLDLITLDFGDEDDESTRAFADTREMIEKESSTKTEVHGTMYFAGFGGEADLEKGLTWVLNWHEGDGNDTKQYTAKTQRFNPSKRVASKTFTSSDGVESKVSPFSVQISADPVMSDSIRKVSLVLKDGTEQVIVDDGVANNYFGLGRDGNVTWVSTRLIDPDSVESVHVERRILDDNGGEPQVLSITLE